MESGLFQDRSGRGEEATLIASTEVWDVLRAIAPAGPSPPNRRGGASVGCAGRSASRRRDRRPSWCSRPISSSSRPPRASQTPPAHAAGDEVRTVIAGYHWFTDWGRDTMISLEGLTLATGRHVEAGYILRTFAHYMRDGLIPNLFPEGRARGPLSHGRRDAVVLPRARPLPRSHRRPRHAAAAAARS